MQDGAYFLDRDPEKFKIILNYLREDELALLTKTELCNLKIEARYFQLTNLLTEINSRLDEIEVYKFRNADVCVEVKKSYFLKVPLSAIVKFMCRNEDVETAFLNQAEPIKEFFNNEIIDVEIPLNAPDLIGYISSVRHCLVLYDEYVRVNATEIKMNVNGHLFPVKISVALKDQDSNFYKCLYNEHNDKICYRLFLDKEGNYSPLAAGDIGLERITTSLQKLEKCSIANTDYEYECTQIEHFLWQIGFLGAKSRLEED